MRAVIQKVLKASVTSENQSNVSISQGLVAFLCIMKEDTEETAKKLADRILHLRLFDQEKRWQSSIQEMHGQILIISNFTLSADCLHGRRPDFSGAAPPSEALSLYRYFGNYLKQKYADVHFGVFGAHMEISLVNDGPVTLMLDTQK